MSVNPYEADFLVLPPMKFRHPGNRSRGDGMITTKGDRHFSRLQCLDHKFGMLGAGCRNLLQIFCVRIAFLLLLGDGDRHIPRIFNYVPKRLQTRFETSHPHRRRPHIHPAARLAEVKRNSDNADFAGSDAGSR